MESEFSEKRQLALLERDVNLKGLMFGMLPTMFIGFGVAPSLGLDMKLWWSFFLVLGIIISFWLAAYFANKNHKKTLLEMLDSLSVSRVHYLAIKTKIVAKYLLLTPLLLVGFILLKLNVSTYFMFGFIILWSLAKGIAQGKAAEQSGYNPS